MQTGIDGSEQMGERKTQGNLPKQEASPCFAFCLGIFFRGGFMLYSQGSVRKREAILCI